MKVRYDKAVLEFIAVSFVILVAASATTRITDTYVNTTGTMNGSVIWEGNVKLTDKYVELSDNLWNTTTQIWVVVDNGTFQKGTELFNTTTQIWVVVDNGTFQKGTELFNTTSQIWSVIDNSTFRKISEGWRGNTTKEIWAVADNNTFVKLSQNLWNTTSQIWAVADNLTFVKKTGDSMSGNLNMTTANVTFSSAGMVRHNGTCVLISGPTSRLEVC